MMRVAIVGCGQLSRMLALAGLPLGLKFSFIADHQGQDTACVEGLGKILHWQTGQSFAQLYQNLGKPDCITVEKEQVDINLLQGLESYCAVYPSSKAVSVCKHRYEEKKLLTALNIPTAAFTYGASVTESASKLGLPLVVKSCSEGYDGKNQWMLETQADIDAFQAQQDSNDNASALTEFIVEQKIPFNKEVSLISVRDLQGNIAHYPLAENVHEKGILKQSVAPALESNTRIGKIAQDYISQILIKLNYIGVLAMECFVVNNGLLINELAPRVHNSGHWTQLGSVTCQFENHLRAITGLPLGSTESHGAAGMINLIGTPKLPLELLTEKSKLHWYNKAVRPGRKLGHVNFIGRDHDDLQRQMKDFQAKYQALELESAASS